MHFSEVTFLQILLGYIFYNKSTELMKFCAFFYLSRHQFSILVWNDL